MNTIEFFMQKLSSYKLFNFLFPGIIFYYIINNYTKIHINKDENIIISIAMIYFLGMILNRIGAIIESIFRKFKIIQFAEYKDFDKAEKKDEKLQILNEINNMYRTIISLFIISIIIKTYEILFDSYNFTDIKILILLLTILFLFIYSYRRQIKFIKDRVETILSIPE